MNTPVLCSATGEAHDRATGSRGYRCGSAIAAVLVALSACSFAGGRSDSARDARGRSDDAVAGSERVNGRQPEGIGLRIDGAGEVHRDPAGAAEGAQEQTPISDLAPGRQVVTNADHAITRQARVAVESDLTLSQQARDCRITTIDGVVTLRGTTAGIDESLAIDAMVGGIDGVRQVINRLDDVQ